MSETTKFKVEISGVLPFEFGQEYQANEIGMMVMGKKVYDFFPSINDIEVKTKFFVVNETLNLPNILVTVLRVRIKHLEKGAYKIEPISF